MKLLSFALLVCTFSGASPLCAATIRVPEDSPSILAALDLAIEGDSVVVGPGTWTERATRGVVTACGFLKGGVSLVGREGPGQTIINAGGSTLFTAIGIWFSNYPGKSSSIDGFTILEPGGTGFMIAAGSAKRLTVRNCRLLGGEFTLPGRALYAPDIDLVLEDCEISFNSGPGSSVGVESYEGNATIRRCRFEGNTGLALLVFSSYSGYTGTVEDCTFLNNTNPNPGAGAADVEPIGNCVVQRCLFQGNSHVGQVGDSGTLLAGSLSHATIAFNTFAYDSAKGGPSSFPGGLTVRNSPFSEIRNNTF